MKKQDGSDYKETVVKHMWNVTAKLEQEMYFNNWNIQINPFSDVIFKSAREAQDAMRKKLQACPEKRANSAAALTETEFRNIVKIFDEDTPEGVLKLYLACTRDIRKTIARRKFHMKISSYLKTESGTSLRKNLDFLLIFHFLGIAVVQYSTKIDFGLFVLGNIATFYTFVKFELTFSFCGRWMQWVKKW
jgi:hypothetical protein